MPRPVRAARPAAVLTIAALAASGMIAAGPPAAAQPVLPSPQPRLIAPAPPSTIDAPTIRRLGTRADPAAVLTFYYGLLRDDAGAIKQLLKVSRPGKASYRHFLSPSKAAARFGATDATVTAVSNYLTSVGLHPVLDKSRLILKITGTAAEFEAGFGIPVTSYQINDFLVSTLESEPALPDEIKPLVTEEIYIAQTQNNIPVTGPPAPGFSVTDNYPVNTGTQLGACKNLRTSPQLDQMITPDQQATAYGLAQLQRQSRGLTSRGDTGSASVGIISQGSGYSDKRLRASARCFGYRASATRIETDGMTGPLRAPAAGEGDLDTQMATAAMRGGSLRVYESAPTVLGYFLPTAAALSDRLRPDVLSISYYQCEPVVQTIAPIVDLSDAVFTRLGLTGASVLAATGDTGSSGCPGSDIKAVGYPASSPWVTAVGGTRIVLDRSNRRRDEVAWNDTRWTTPRTPIAGGGGTSIMYPRPPWQRRASPSSAGRTVPDLSANASLFPAFPVVEYSSSAFAFPMGGTSSSTPFTAGGLALLNEQQAARRKPPLGLVSPWLYSLPTSAFYDVTRGGNDVAGVGCCKAKRGYDRATGLGAPVFPQLAAKIRPPAKRSR